MMSVNKGGRYKHNMKNFVCTFLTNGTKGIKAK